MISVEPSPISPLREALLRTVIEAENAEDIEAVMVLGLEIEGKRKHND